MFFGVKHLSINLLRRQDDEQLQKKTLLFLLDLFSVLGVCFFMVAAYIRMFAQYISNIKNMISVTQH